MDIELQTIEQVAECTGLSAHTLRYYVRIGLLDPVGRATSGHRRYGTKDLAWIAFLTRLRATGMPIRQMQEFWERRWERAWEGPFGHTRVPAHSTGCCGHQSGGRSLLQVLGLFPHAAP